MKYCVIIPAAGNSTRFSESEDKLLKLINNKNLLAHTITNFLEDTNCIKIILVVQSKIKNLLLVNDLFKDKKIIWTDGGSSRTHSVYQGFLKTIDIKVDNILVHDGARPFVSINLINSLLKEISTKDFALPAIKTTDCIKKVEDNKLITIENENLHAIQTPQAFKKGVLNQAFIKWDKKTIYKDDAELIEKNINSYNFSLVLGEDTNIKVTYKKDLFNNTNDFNGFF